MALIVRSFIVNGQGMYDYHGTQINATWDRSDFIEKQCPGQLANPPRCEYCLNQADWSAELCKESSGDSICGAPAVIEVEAGKESKLRFVRIEGCLLASWEFNKDKIQIVDSCSGSHGAVLVDTVTTRA